MTTPSTVSFSSLDSSNRIRIRAVAVQLVSHLDGRYVDLTFFTDCGQTVSITCDNGAIFKIQRNIEQMARDCPEMASWD